MSSIVQVVSERERLEFHFSQLYECQTHNLYISNLQLENFVSNPMHTLQDRASCFIAFSFFAQTCFSTISHVGTTANLLWFDCQVDRSAITLSTFFLQLR